VEIKVKTIGAGKDILSVSSSYMRNKVCYEDVIDYGHFYYCSGGSAVFLV